MTREEWAKVEEQLRHPYSAGVKLRVDEHELTLRVERYKGLRYRIAVYIDGTIKGEWMLRSSDIGAKFWFPRMSSLFSAAAFKQMEKNHGKRFAARMRKDNPPSVVMHDPWFPSVVALRRHLVKTCTSIELVGCSYWAAGVPA